MFLAEITNRGNIPVLEKALAFAESRQKVLAHNVANVDVPGFKPRQLSPELFQQTLREAITDRGSDPRRSLTIPDTEEFHLDDRGRLVVTPDEEPAQNILFHDRTNARMEVLMAHTAENVMAFNLYSQLLNGSFDGLKTAIRGQI